MQRHANVGLVGQFRVGKSHLLQAVGLSACSLGYRVLYTTSAQMLLRLTAALADKSLTETLRFYAKWDLLLVDEFGFDRIEREECPQAAHLLYKVVDSRHQKRSTILITNRLCAAAHNKFNAANIFMRSKRRGPAGRGRAPNKYQDGSTPHEGDPLLSANA